MNQMWAGCHWKSGSHCVIRSTGDRDDGCLSHGDSQT